MILDYFALKRKEKKLINLYIENWEIIKFLKIKLTKKKNSNYIKILLINN